MSNVLANRLASFLTAFGGTDSESNEMFAAVIAAMVEVEKGKKAEKEGRNLQEEHGLCSREEEVDQGREVVLLKEPVGVDASADVIESAELASTHGSWSEEVEESARGGVGCGSESSLEMPSRPEVSDKVKALEFGMAKCYPQVGVAEVGGTAKSEPVGFYKTYVNNPQTKALQTKLEDLCGEKLPKQCRRDLALCCYTAGSMPDELIGGKERLKGLAVLGDATITLHVTTAVVQSGKVVQSAQKARSDFTSDVFLCSVLVSKGLVGMVSAPPGVNLRQSKPGATALEAMVGVVALHCSPMVVKQLVLRLGVVSV